MSIDHTITVKKQILCFIGNTKYTGIHILSATTFYIQIIRIYALNC